MDPHCLEHLLTEEERRHFEEQGYLIVPQVLEAAQLAALEAATDRIWTAQQAAGLGPDQNLFFPNFVGCDPLFAELVDHPRILPLVWGLLGWNIYLYHSHLGVTPQEGPPGTPFKEPLGFHQDSGRVNAEMEFHPRPRLSLKVAYWLSDVSAPGRGNFYIVPGSHLNDDLPRPSDRNPAGAIPVLANAGDAVFFDRRLWHARSLNHSPVVRKALFYGYGYRWLRTKDDMTIPPELLTACDPIRRQLLGVGTNANGFFSPKDEDVPLKVWLEGQGLLEKKG
ncbi:MAG: phytanoyl-CoA dioxygenase family protein [Candidatus Latescibacteria bacterium]|nr:phytanoyl-CoA dioxygenase family protein [Candidatus Latescibacterota bacterium]